jgi:hypothetical protein
MRPTVIGLSAMGLAALAVSGRPGAETDEALVRRACAGCHTATAPDVLPRGSWKTVLYEMAGMIMGNVGAPKDAPPLSLDFDVERLVRYYEARAPQALAPPEIWPSPGAGRFRFLRHPMRLAPVASATAPAGDEPLPVVSHVRFLDLDGSGRLAVLATDMSSGQVLRGDPREPARGMALLGRGASPCHLEVVDLDRDGLRDLIVADLGDVPPEDHEKGAVLWLRRRPAGTFEPVVLAQRLPRVADVQAADVDGDGDLDLVAAAFGWRTVGALLLLENRTTDWASPSFVRRELDPRAGSLHVPTVDLDGDGRRDIVALFAQHYESVEAFLGDGRGGFRNVPLFSGPHPAWGSSGLELVDFDRDGDQDVLVTNGDMLDDFLIKPYHGIRWLENQGSLVFREHPLAGLPGVHRALARDLDGDGDLDVVAGAYVQFRGEMGPPRSRTDLASLVILEQAAPGRFEKHTLETGGHHVTLDAADYDGDGDVDLAVGTFRTEGGPVLELWESQGTAR